MAGIANVIPVVISRKGAHLILATVDGATAPTDPNSSDFEAMVDFVNEHQLKTMYHTAIPHYWFIKNNFYSVLQSIAKKILYYS